MSDFVVGLYIIGVELFLAFASLVKREREKEEKNVAFVLGTGLLMPMF